MRLVGLALASVLALYAAPAASDAGSDALVACSIGGRLVLEREADCLKAGGQPSSGRDQPAEPAGNALRLENDAGLTVRSVLACRTAQALGGVTSRDPGTRWMLAQALVRSGDCTRIERDTGFTVVERRAGALRVRVPTAGLVWVSEWVEIPDVDRLELTSPPLQPAPDAGSASPGVAPSEQPQAATEPSGKQSARRARADDGHTRTCSCSGKVRITAQRDCREACGASFRSTVHDACDREGCYWHGELMSRKEMADHEAGEEGME